MQEYQLERKNFPLTSFNFPFNYSFFHSFLFTNIYRRAFWESDAVGGVEGAEVDAVEADACTDRHDSTEQFAMPTRIEAGQWQRVIAADGLVCALRSLEAHFPDEIVGSAEAEPRLQHVAGAEALVLPQEELPRVLQPQPELHETCLRVVQFIIHNAQFIIINVQL